MLATLRMPEGILLSLAALLVAVSVTGCFGAGTARGHMLVPRDSQSATLLPDGRVLIVGGFSGYGQPSLSSAELYDPKTGIFSATGSMGVARSAHSATLLPDGRVLVAGGVVGSHQVEELSSAELYDPKTGTFISIGSMTRQRSGHAAILLKDGTVLIAGEGGTSAELYDPTTGKFRSTGSMLTDRLMYQATMLLDGRVLIAGGSYETIKSLATAELYDPASSTFAATGSLATARQWYAAAALPDGRALIAGGETGFADTLATAEVYDPLSGTFSPTGSMAEARHLHTATTLSDGRVLVAGGLGKRYGPNGNSQDYLSSAEVFDPRGGAFSSTGSMANARVGHTATLLSDGRVLVLGGSDDYGTLASAEIYDPKTGTFGSAA